MSGAPAGGDAVLDREALSRLRQELRDPTVLPRIFETFRRETPGRLARLRAAVQAGDVEETRQAAHAARNGAVTLAAERMASLCQKLETEAESGSLRDAAADVERLQEAFTEASTALAGELMR